MSLCQHVVAWFNSFRQWSVVNRQSQEPPSSFVPLTLPPPPTPLGVYKPFLIVGNFVYVSGHGTVKEDKSLIIGKIGTDLNIEEGKLAARQVGLAILSTL